MHEKSAFRKTCKKTLLQVEQTLFHCCSCVNLHVQKEIHTWIQCSNQVKCDLPMYLLVLEWSILLTFLPVFPPISAMFCLFPPCDQTKLQWILNGIILAFLCYDVSQLYPQTWEMTGFIIVILRSVLGGINVLAALAVVLIIIEGPCRLSFLPPWWSLHLLSTLSTEPLQDFMRPSHCTPEREI